MKRKKKAVTFQETVRTAEVFQGRYSFSERSVEDLANSPKGARNLFSAFRRQDDFLLSFNARGAPVVFASRSSMKLHQDDDDEEGHVHGMSETAEDSRTNLSPASPSAKSPEDLLKEFASHEEESERKQQPFPPARSPKEVVMESLLHETPTTFLPSSPKSSGEEFRDFSLQENETESNDRGSVFVTATGTLLALSNETFRKRRRLLISHKRNQELQRCSLLSLVQTSRAA